MTNKCLDGTPMYNEQQIINMERIRAWTIGTMDHSIGTMIYI